MRSGTRDLSSKSSRSRPSLPEDRLHDTDAMMAGHLGSYNEPARDRGEAFDSPRARPSHASRFGDFDRDDEGSPHRDRHRVSRDDTHAAGRPLADGYEGFDPDPIEEEDDGGDYEGYSVDSRPRVADLDDDENDVASLYGAFYNDPEGVDDLDRSTRGSGDRRSFAAPPTSRGERNGGRGFFRGSEPDRNRAPGRGAEREAPRRRRG